MRWTRRFFLLLALVLGPIACASLPPPAEKPRSVAFAEPQTTGLGRLVQASAPSGSASGIRLLIAGEDALASILALADNAERSLDIQYYIVRNDASSRTVMRRVHAAAARGVRVRMLVDDLNTAAADESLLCLTRHGNIELRLYNPFPAGRFSMLTRVLGSLTDIERINQRMHAKMFVADNAMAITGGRNIGDEYFLRSPSSNFVDLDILAAGPVVRAMSDTFDRFWNDELAYPIDELVKQQPDCAGPVSAQPQRDPAAEAAPAGSDSTDAELTGSDPVDPAVAPNQAAGEPDPGALARDLAAKRLELNWVDALLVADSPPKAEGSGRAGSVAAEVTRLFGSARREVVIITPYFVPGEHGMAAFRALRERDVAVHVLTNSLASTDAPIVHIGYARYRSELLELGVELHELRPQLGRPRSGFGGFGKSLASLHAKALVIDGHIALIGSMNMDPRSMWLNSELAIVIPDDAIATQVRQLYDDVIDEGSYRVRLGDDGELQWIGGEPGAPVAEGREPGASLGVRALLFLLAPFAPDEML